MVHFSRPCDQIDLEMSSPLTTANGTFMAYIGKDVVLHIQCSFSCENCTKDFIIWRKEGQPVYQKSWKNPSSSGPFPQFVNFVNRDLVVDNDDNGEYVVEWLQATEDDLPAGQDFTSWECFARTGSCPQELDSSTIEYYSEFFIVDQLNTEG